MPTYTVTSDRATRRKGRKARVASRVRLPWTALGLTLCCQIIERREEEEVEAKFTVNQQYFLCKKGTRYCCPVPTPQLLIMVTVRKIGLFHISRITNISGPTAHLLSYEPAFRQQMECNWVTRVMSYLIPGIPDTRQDSSGLPLCYGSLM